MVQLGPHKKESHVPIRLDTRKYQSQKKKVIPPLQSERKNKQATYIKSQNDIELENVLTMHSYPDRILTISILIDQELFSSKTLAELFLIIGKRTFKRKRPLSEVLSPICSIWKKNQWTILWFNKFKGP